MTTYRKHQATGSSTVHIQCVECHAFDREHRGNCSSLRPFPIQNGGQIPWWLAEVAFDFYHANWPSQSLERISERGGFGVVELVCFLRKNEEYGWARDLKEKPDA